MTTAMVFGLCGAGAAGLGLYGVIVNPRPLRKILAFNLLSSESSCSLALLREEAGGRHSTAIQCRKPLSSRELSSRPRGQRWRLRFCCVSSKRQDRKRSVLMQ